MTKQELGPRMRHSVSPSALLQRSAKTRRVLPSPALGKQLFLLFARVQSKANLRRGGRSIFNGRAFLWRRTPLNIDGALGRSDRSMLWSSSHNYTSASRCMHHTHIHLITSHRTQPPHQPRGIHLHQKEENGKRREKTHTYRYKDTHTLTDTHILAHIQIHILTHLQIHILTHLQIHRYSHTYRYTDTHTQKWFPLVEPIMRQPVDVRHPQRSISHSHRYR